MKKTYDEINKKIAAGEAVILTAEEVSKMAETTSPEEIAKNVDVVTTATFGPMCSSGAFINFGHADPPIRMEKIFLNGVEAYGGIAAVDTYIGVTQVSRDNPRYGGAHVIEALIAGKDIELKAQAPGTDCYPRKSINTKINRDSVNEMIMFNPRNAYQNYPAATNSTSDKKYTYMGILLPKFGNVTYSTSGELSPLLNDPEMRTIGIGTRIFLCGAQGYVSWHGTQFRTSEELNTQGIPISSSATLALIGDMKEMNPAYLKAAYYEKYGTSLFVGIGIPIPILDEDIAHRVSIKNREIDTQICDYGVNGHPVVTTINYEQLQSGKITLNGKKVCTAPMSSLKKAREIAELLKNQIRNGKFYLTEPVQQFPKVSELNRLKEID
ncbi:MAG: homocysteine biosynthesis protein [Candidatus Marinimicrobia bacterium]|nr:homocysteine biosynthesis protein [Candidatus Neomarinimicrobiota bacterium]